MLYISSYIVAGVVLTGTAHAFPDIQVFGSTKSSSVAAAPSSTAVPFDAKSQYVSTTGNHAWQAPGTGDARGPCPGLNAMANHAYIPRTGLATITEFISGTHDAFGMAGDLSTILAAYGAILDGAGLLWSIGGTEHIGIGGSHNNYETDSSPMRGDLHQYGSNIDLVIDQFNELYNMQPDAETANYDLEVLRAYRYSRFNQSIAQDPYFYYAPFSGAVVSQAAFIFIFRFFGNKSEEYPAGYLNKDVLKSFFSIQGPDDNLTWVPGNERIPDNWYRLNDNDLYSLQKLEQDIKYFAAGDSRIAQPGCNMGKANTFVPINTTAMTAGAYGPADVLADPLCFGLAFAEAQSAQLGPLAVVSEVLGELILPIQNALGCETIPSLNETVAQACPGYSLYGGPTAPVAPGSIQ